jgi:hypothetical protein
MFDHLAADRGDLRLREWIFTEQPARIAQQQSGRRVVRLVRRACCSVDGLELGPLKLRPEHRIGGV